MSTGPEPGSDPSQRRLVLVAGVGRSGTSVFTGILGQVGFRVPQPEVQADATNPRGFGEPKWVVDFHKRLLDQRRVRVFDSRPAAWARTANAALDDAIFHELRAWLAVQFVGADHVVVKDPRIGWFVPLWARCARDLEIPTSFVTMLRHPAEILNSSRKWYGTWQTDASRATAWLNGMLQTEQSTRDERRVFVRYEDLLRGWAQETSRVGEVLGLEPLTRLDPARYPQVDRFVDPTLHRSKVTWSDVPVPPAVQAMAEDVWKEFTALAEPGGDNPQRRADLDAARESYARLYADAEAVAQSSIIAASPPKKPAAAGESGARSGGSRGGAAGGPRASLAVRLAGRVPKKYRRLVPAGWRRRARRLAAKVAGTRD